MCHVERVYRKMVTLDGIQMKLHLCTKKLYLDSSIHQVLEAEEFFLINSHGAQLQTL